jgi:heat shock protein HtpX
MYEQIAHNRRASIALLAALLAVGLGLGFAIGVAYSGSTGGGLGFLAIFGAVTIAWSLIAYYRGGAIVLATSGAHPVTHESHPQLFNVVEELTLAGGLPMPQVYVIDDAAPNAFATGRDPAHAAVAVTTGLLEMMNRDELQGVLAHELSHVRNYDIRFATLVGVVVGMIALIADFFLRVRFFGGRRDGGGGSLGLIFLLIAVLLAIIAPLAAMTVQFAVSRRREYLADASSVELTRNPAGLASALEKIAADPRPLARVNRATAHLYIANPLKRKKLKETSGLFDTHPPIQKRIEILRAMETGAAAV